MNLFDQLVESILQENANVAGGAGSVLGGGVTSTATQFSGDTYASGDARVAKPLGKGVITRNLPKDTIYSGKVRRKHKRRHKKKH